MGDVSNYDSVAEAVNRCFDSVGLPGAESNHLGVLIAYFQGTVTRNKELLQEVRTKDARLMPRKIDSSTPWGRDMRDYLGAKVREVWIRWAKERPNPKPSWLVPYDQLEEPDKEADRMIGEALWSLGLMAAGMPTSLTVDLTAAQKAELEEALKRDTGAMRFSCVELKGAVPILVPPPAYYVVVVEGDIEPGIPHGPFTTEDERDEAARKERKDNGDGNGIFALDIVDGKPVISAYSGDFFER